MIDRRKLLALFGGAAVAPVVAKIMPPMPVASTVDLDAAVAMVTENVAAASSIPRQMYTYQTMTLWGGRELMNYAERAIGHGVLQAAPLPRED